MLASETRASRHMEELLTIRDVENGEIVTLLKIMKLVSTEPFPKQKA